MPDCSPDPTKKACCFCSGSFLTLGRSSEHVIPEWLLKRMGVKAQDKHRWLETGRDNQTIDEGHFGAHSVLFNQVCAKCNNGWMHDLEVSTKPILERVLASSKGEIMLQEALTLSNWMFKTMALLQITQRNERRLLVEGSDLEYFYSSHIPPGHANLCLYQRQSGKPEKLFVYLPRMLYLVPSGMSEGEVAPLKRCFVCYIQLGIVLFGYVYLNPPNRWEFLEADRIPSGQVLWPNFKKRIPWHIGSSVLPELSKDDYVVPLALVI